MTQTAPLSGYLVVVARDDAPEDNISSYLSSQGARVIALPLMRIERVANFGRLDRALLELSRFDCIAFASPVAVNMLVARSQELGVQLSERVPPIGFAAVGHKTASALQSHGLPVAVVGEAGGEELGDRLHTWLHREEQTIDRSRPRCILLPRAIGGRDELKAYLERTGAEVEAIEIYRSVPREDAPRRFQETLQRIRSHTGPCGIVLTSPMRVEAFGALCAQQAQHIAPSHGHEPRTEAPLHAFLPKLTSCNWIAIGEVTRAAMQAHGLLATRAASQPTPEAVMAALLAK